MVRFWQDNSGTIDCLCGEIIESIICVNWIDNNIEQENLFVLWLKIQSKDFWLRFFIDAGICFGEKYKLSEFRDIYAEDIEGNSSYSFSDRYILSNTTIVSAQVNPINNNSGVKLSFYLEDRQIISMICDIFDGNTKIVLSN